MSEARRERQKGVFGVIGVVIAVAGGFSTPEELRQAGASMVVADLHELLRAVT